MALRQDLAGLNTQAKTAADSFLVHVSGRSCPRRGPFHLVAWQGTAAGEQMRVDTFGQFSSSARHALHRMKAQVCSKPSSLLLTRRALIPLRCVRMVPHISDANGRTRWGIFIPTKSLHGQTRASEETAAACKQTVAIPQQTRCRHHVQSSDLAYAEEKFSLIRRDIVNL
jgi:hypothetical protein